MGFAHEFGTFNIHEIEPHVMSATEGGGLWDLAPPSDLAIGLVGLGQKMKGKSYENFTNRLYAGRSATGYAGATEIKR